ncbi:MAG: HD-GYP domain-containing protein [Eubacteriales bacterium]
MIKFNVLKLQPGMVLAESVVAHNGQQILDKDTVLDEKCITKLAFNAVTYVQLKANEAGEPIIEKIAEKRESLHERTVNSQEFKVFKKSFEDTKEAYATAVNDIVTNNAEVDSKKLTEHVLDLFTKSSQATSVFDVLHSMREYDDSTYTHCINVSLISVVFGKWLGMSQEELDTLSLAGLLHDIGKLLIPDEIVKKPTQLTDEEFLLMKTHPQKGYDLLKEANLSDHVKNAILMHHEKCDGTGYPNGLTADKIDEYAKIVAIADVYDATTSARVYRGALCPFKVLEIFKEEGYQKYDTRFIMTFMERVVNTYIGQDVLLSNDEIATVIFVNKLEPSRPIVKTATNCYDLSQMKDVSIMSLV